VLIGSPVSESLSLVLQQAAFDAAGLDVRYELWDRRPIELPDAIEELRGEDFLGASVTIPHKERVVPMVERITEEARDTGAVDTITKEAARLVGHNTDVPAFRTALDKLVGKQKMPRAAVVLGAGGGARAVVYGLIIDGFQRVVVFNRHLHRAEGLVRHFAKMAAHMELRAMPWHESVIEAELAKTKLLVNASSVGMLEDETPIAGELIPPELLVLDLIHVLPQTRLLRDAAAAGCQTMNGELMLLHQSAAAFTLWTGKPAPLKVMQERLDDVRGASRAAPTPQLPADAGVTDAEPAAPIGPSERAVPATEDVSPSGDGDSAPLAGAARR
jgi:shikimate dehydrogenase